MDTNAFGNLLKDYGYDFFSGVPCSFLKPLINHALNERTFVMAANEGDAVAMASGAWLAGKKACVLMQNSGLTNASSPLTSLNDTFEIPVLGFVSLRGEPGLKDAPQHGLMGQITGDMLDVMRIPWAFLPDDIEDAKAALDEAETHIKNRKSFFFVVKKGTLDPVSLTRTETKKRGAVCLMESAKDNEIPTREKALSVIHGHGEDGTILIAPTGKAGRELNEHGDRDTQIYMVGSMGCAGSLALGIALNAPDKKVIAIDGDGALLMRLGSMATNASVAPKNMLHVLLDNGCHDTTGGQATAAPMVDFAAAAAACGYPTSSSVSTCEELNEKITEWKKDGGLSFITMKVAKGARSDLGRPDVPMPDIAKRFRKGFTS